jgi:hypothetical protein
VCAGLYTLEEFNPCRNGDLKSFHLLVTFGVVTSRQIILDDISYDPQGYSVHLVNLSSKELYFYLTALL